MKVWVTPELISHTGSLAIEISGTERLQFNLDKLGVRPSRQYDPKELHISGPDKP